MNLARAWRPKTFDEIVGQELTVRILKNSLYRNQLFPVYLLSGQRGCGKTTTGRVFAAAINCARRAEFSQSPQAVVLPCLTCQSCSAMTTGNHPDFIEIDAASHTGVDNVRALIESSSYMPVLGAHKIYLIDEAHMLSKAAFNAFLKILEEPTANVLFMLATTDAHKIIDTVKSRCFHLFFDAIAPEVLLNHLSAVCTQERIPYDDQGLHGIIKKSEGSARDALNILERIRLAAGSVTAQAVTAVLGIVDCAYVVQLLEKVTAGSLPQLLDYMRDASFKKYAAADMYDQLRAIIRECIWQTQGLSQGLPEYNAIIKPLALTASVQQWVQYWQLLYDAEASFIKASAQHDVLQLVLVKMAALHTVPVTSVAPATITEVQRVPPREPVSASATTPWQDFLQKLSAGDPLVLSLFKQGNPEPLQQDTLRVEFPHKLQFFKEKFIETTPVWQPLLSQSYGKTVVFEPFFVAPRAPMAPKEIKKGVMPERGSERQPVSKKVYTGEQVDMITRIFPGTIEEITDQSGKEN